jgi:hypothetical protein
MRARLQALTLAANVDGMAEFRPTEGKNHRVNGRTSPVTRLGAVTHINFLAIEIPKSICNPHLIASSGVAESFDVDRMSGDTTIAITGSDYAGPHRA